MYVFMLRMGSIVGLVWTLTIVEVETCEYFVLKCIFEAQILLFGAFLHDFQGFTWNKMLESFTFQQDWFVFYHVIGLIISQNDEKYVI